MKPLMVGVCALDCLVAEAGSARAAWNNVFQTTLFGRKKTTVQYVAPAPVVAYAAPVAVAAPPCSSCASPAPAPCAQPSCSTSYVQRCYYQPVTTYQTQTYYEPVTSYRTSYYYEPVTSYRYSCYYDPCSCGYQQVATPVTSYQLRAQSCPVQSWVQRCASVPVTTYQKSCYWQPQTTCCQTTEGAPIPVAPPVMAPVMAPANPPVVTQTPAPPANPTYPPPVINEQKSGPPNGQYERYYPQKQSNVQPPTFGAPAGRPAPPPPPVKLDRIVVGPDAKVEGQVVRSDNAPRPNARVLFVSADRLAASQNVIANVAGRFQVSLAPGGWLIYLDAPDGTQIYHSRIEVNPNQPSGPRILLVNR